VDMTASVRWAQLWRTFMQQGRGPHYGGAISGPNFPTWPFGIVGIRPKAAVHDRPLSEGGLRRSALEPVIKGPTVATH
jgi:hypothetical protein